MTDTEGQEVILLGMGPSGPRASKVGHFMYE